MDAVLVVLDATQDPYSQVNVTIIGNLQARNIPVLIVANKVDLKKADGQDRWEGGTVIDPEEGKIYKARLTPVDGGKKLELRGYIGVPMFGRTQTWIRVE